MQPRPDDESPAGLPAGYSVHESVHGRVTLRSERARRTIQPAELDWLRTFLRQRPRLRCCRVENRGKTIVFFEPRGTEYDDRLRREHSGDAEREWPLELRRARYDAVMRLRLIDASTRIFAADRMNFSASINGWWDLGRLGPLTELAKQLLPHLMHTTFYKLAP
jgi:hypothetical protein